MSTVSNNAEKLETASCSGGSGPFGDLRGVRWRIDLGILPSCPSVSIDDFRRITADSRRRYAALRRQLLVDPHVPKDGSSSPDRVMDNPLSQSPDSMWGRFFRNAELERMVDQDLTRLSPEKSCGYFQTSRCQGMLRRILLLWSLRHPEYGYRQGMQELLAPLLYVLHVDVERLSKVRKVYDDQFVDKFDSFSFHENDFSYKFDFKKFSKYVQEDNGFENNPARASSCDPTELNPGIQTIILLSDAYGAEGELGIVLSEKFIEHDAYSMFDSLMTGSGNGALAISDFFFSPSHSGVPPVIEASAALYHLLSNIDMPLYTHLMELGVEPQYFGLRWLRLLFEREFSLEDLLVVWDEIFSCKNTRSNKGEDTESGFGVLESPRGAFICAFGISMILHMRSSLLATENATACLQRLLNFPGDVEIVKLLSKAKSFYALALEADISIPLPIQFGLNGGRRSAVITRCHSFCLDSTSPKTPLNVVANSYWEEKWRVLHKENEEEENKGTEQVPNRRKGWSERVRLCLSRTESDQTPLRKKNGRRKIPRPSVRKSLLDDLARQLGSDEDNEIIEGCDQESVDHHKSTEVNDQDDIMDDKSYENASGSEVINRSPDLSDRTSSNECNTENENESERSIVTSNSFIDKNDLEPCGADPEPEGSILPVSDLPDGLSPKSIQKEVLLEKFRTGTKERKLLSAKFQWLWKFGRNNNNNYDGASEGVLESRSASEDAKACARENDGNNVLSAGRCDHRNKGGTVDQNLMVSLKTIGQSMLENIQVIETIFQQDLGQTRLLENLTTNGLVGKGQVTAMTALKELRKISNLLSEM